MAELNNVVLVLDLDKTLCTKKQSNESYSEVLPKKDLVDIINTLHNNGAEVTPFLACDVLDVDAYVDY